MKTLILIISASVVGLTLLLAWTVKAQEINIAAAGTTERVSVSSDGGQANDNSDVASISVDGRYVVFASEADNLVSGDTNTVCDTDHDGQYDDNCQDIFVHDRQTGQTTRVSIASNGNQANGASYPPDGSCISADGRYVVFDSSATNLVSGDTNGQVDTFVHDRQTGQTTRVSVASDGTQANSGSNRPVISADGRYVAFDSDASDLVSGDTNDSYDIFVHDRQTGQTSLVSVNSNGIKGNLSSQVASISADGRYVAFFSNASNLVSGDTNLNTDIFVHDRQTGQTTRVSVASDGTQANGRSWVSTISADGRYVVFESDASNLVSDDTNTVCDTDEDGQYDDNCRDIFVHDRQTGQTTRVSVASDGTQGNGRSWWSAISADGRYVAFQSDAANLVSDDTNDGDDVFVHDRRTGQTTRVSVAWNGQQANYGGGTGTTSFISGDGRYVAFMSWASNLVNGDTNHTGDVFVRDRGQGEAITRAIIPTSGGSLTSWTYHTTLTFPTDTFTTTVAVTYTGYFPIRYSPPVSMTEIGPSFDLTGVYSDTGQPAQPTRPYTITVQYTDAEQGPAIENTLTLYYWDGSRWVKEPSSMVNVVSNTITATPNHFSSWAVLGEAWRVFLPVILKN